MPYGLQYFDIEHKVQQYPLFWTTCNSYFESICAFFSKLNLLLRSFFELSIWFYFFFCDCHLFCFFVSVKHSLLEVTVGVSTRMRHRNWTAETGCDTVRKYFAWVMVNRFLCRYVDLTRSFFVCWRNKC